MIRRALAPEARLLSSFFHLSLEACSVNLPDPGSTQLQQGCLPPPVRVVLLNPKRLLSGLPSVAE